MQPHFLPKEITLGWTSHAYLIVQIILSIVRGCMHVLTFKRYVKAFDENAIMIRRIPLTFFYYKLKIADLCVSTNQNSSTLSWIQIKKCYFLLSINCHFVTKELLFLWRNGATKCPNLFIMHHESQTIFCNLFLWSINGDNLMESRHAIKTLWLYK